MSETSDPCLMLRQPVEILIAIFQKCNSLKDMMALSSTCSRLRSCFTSSSTQILYPTVASEYIAFDDALAAVRATAIVVSYHDECNKSTVPRSEGAPNQATEGTKTPYIFGSPKIPLEKLLPGYRRPNLAEVQEVHKLQRLMDRMTDTFSRNAFLQRDRRGGSPYDPAWLFYYGTWSGSSLTRSAFAKEQDPPDSTDQEISEAQRERAGAWWYRFYSSSYNAIVAGVYLAPFYLEPFTSENKCPEQDDIIASFAETTYPSEEDEDETSGGGGLELLQWPSPRELTPEGQSFLEDFPVYNCVERDKPAAEKVFMPLLKYLIQRGRRSELDCENPYYWSDRSKPEKWSAEMDVRKLLMVLNAYEVLFSLFGRGYQNNPGASTTTQNDNPDDQPQSPQAQDFKATTSVDIHTIVFGFFQLETIRMLPQGTNRRLMTTVRLDIPDIFSQLVYGSNRGTYLVPGDLFFFDFALREYFGYEFYREGFDGWPTDHEPWRYYPWLHKGEIFFFDMETAMPCIPINRL
ncbi:hypothetical protein TWF281_003814 [Arthrobotrys megalospora]